MPWEKWNSFHQAIEYTKDPKAKKHERIFFITLYDASKAKKAEDPHQQIFLEECVPTKDQIKKIRELKQPSLTIIL
ncbi:1962_t:CDS:2 [Gigaspora margarita]|uniref:1962_t:CDS:1 n=1 Tax=Gigaspora margarita TaxID=4874 RepID=A0ABN7UIG8_GIGMA|nr:1962_t:CDS:2 [Gigaspora margarita]